MKIEKSLLINLKSRPDRLKQATEQLSKSSFPGSWDVVEGIQVSEKDKCWFTHPGEMGCYQSMLKCLDIARKCSGHVIIMEDDLMFSDKFEIEYQWYLDQLDANDSWDVFYFYNTHNTDLGRRIIKDTPSKASHFWIVNKKSAAYIYELTSRSQMPVDGCLYILAKKNGLVNLWSAGEQLVLQNTTTVTSCIHQGRLSWFRRNHCGVYV